MPAQAAAPTCLSKEYLQQGVVLFKDACTQEWAMSTTTVATLAPADSSCLVKLHLQDGAVLFQDRCTSEWAQNPPPAQEAQAPQQ